MTRIAVALAALLSLTLACAQAKNLAGQAGLDDKDLKAAEGEARKEAVKAAEDAPKDLYQLAAYKGFSQLTAMLSKAGLDKTLEGAGPFTLFAPTDEAFNKLPAETRAMLMSDAGAEQLKAILSYHLVAGKHLAADVAKMTSAKTVNGADVAIAATDGKVTVGGAQVTQADLEATNGVLHVIDTVLTPPGA